jgi:glutamate 5-kinase
MRTRLSDARRIIIKIGSTLLTQEGSGLAHNRIAQWVEQIVALRRQDYEIIIVSSGAIAAGMQRLAWTARPQAIHQLQAAAAVGQMELARSYETLFSQHACTSAQILLTHDDLADRQRYLNARSTLTTLLDLGVIPIINENDTVVIEEIKLGDNDTLAALVANLLVADLLIILTDQAGLFDADPRQHPQARLISEHRADDPALEAQAGGAGSIWGTGGMRTKVKAAQRAARSGTHTLIANGDEDNILLRLVAGEPLGSLLYANCSSHTARELWLANQLQLAGQLALDPGATLALQQGKSLLPVGVKDVQGHFERGACVSCHSPTGEEIARGLVNYASDDARRIAGKKSEEIKNLLGYVLEEELIHRSNLVLRSA